MTYPALLTEDCTIWELSARNEFNEFSFSAPRVIKTRFQDSINRLIDDQGTEFLSTAIVYATEMLPKNCFLYRGISTELNPKLQSDAYQLRVVQRSQSPNGSIVVYKHTI